MNLGEMISDSLKYPFKDISKLLILFLLFIGSILIVPAILAVGYSLRIIEYTTNGEEELPPFNEWWNMLIDGLKYILVSIVYFIVPFILLIVSLAGIIATTYTGGSQIGLYLVLTIISIILLIIIDLIYIMALGHLAHEKRLGAAFDFNGILSFIGDMGWLKYFAYILVFSIVGTLLSFIGNIPPLLEGPLGIAGTLIGTLLSLIISVYTIIFQSRFIGLIYPSPEAETVEETEYFPPTESMEN